MSAEQKEKSAKKQKNPRTKPIDMYTKEEISS